MRIRVIETQNLLIAFLKLSARDYMIRHMENTCHSLI